MNAQDIRNAYLKFFEERGHIVIPRTQLILQGDPTTLFTGSGMQPMIPYLLGESHPKGKRIVDSQTCLRAQDIDDIGDNRHTTFFEMLGNWSLGDYFKKEQIPWMFEFLVDIVGLDPSRLYVTCYYGNEKFGIPKDTEAAEIWAELFADKGLSNKTADMIDFATASKRGMKDGERIFFYDGSKNWWSRNGNEANTPVGDPCGPDTEFFYEFADIPHDSAYGEQCHPNCDCGRYMEVGNNVFMAYKKVSEETFEPLAKPNVDHGSGLERIAAAAIDSPDMFKISLMWPIVEKLETISGKTYDEATESMRVIADHLRAATFLAVDGLTPSNKEQGYVMRRLIRRAVLKSFDLGIEQNFLEELVPVIASLYEHDFPEVKDNKDQIIAVLVKEEKAFRQTLRKGLKEFEKFFSESQESRVKSQGEMLFSLYDTYGFPVELSIEEATKRSIKLDNDWQAQFDAKMKEQRERSQTATKGTFKGGLEGQELIHKKYHTATHLLQSALRQIFGETVRQHGSNITAERLRFDFSLDRKMTPEEIAEAEKLVNGWIAENNLVKFTLYPTQDALDMGAIGPFGERYGDTVKVYQMGADDHIVSLEICGGPHVDNTGILAEGGKTFKVTKEEASSAGIRRIKAELV